MDKDFLNEYRCGCGKLIFKERFENCKIEIKCRRCGKIQLIDFSDEIRLKGHLKNFDSNRRED